MVVTCVVRRIVALLPRRPAHRVEVLPSSESRRHPHIRHVADVSETPHRDDRVVYLLVCFDDPDPPQGHLRAVDPLGPGTVFVGWLGLLAALEEALRADQPPPEEPDEGGDLAG